MANGAALLATVLAATPLAPLAPFIGALGKLLGGWINENDKAAKAQANLLDARNAALEQARYVAFMERWTAGVNLYNAGAYALAEEAFASAEAAGQEARLQVGRKIDATEVGSYRAWMAKGWGVTSSEEDHFYFDGWRRGGGGFTGQPAISGTEGKTNGLWYYRDIHGVNRRFHWRSDHPDYEGTVVPPVSAEYAAMVEAAMEERRAKAMVEERTGAGTGGYINNTKSDKRTGTTLDGDWYDPGAVTTTTPTPPVVTQPAPSPAPAPNPPVPPAPAPAPTPTKPPVRVITPTKNRDLVD
ncbi:MULTISPECIES: hypothetical protein [unclassified Corallococcus]|uniref:hypothetical protein n=1 Tax=unclassified Corallococcus TaxID=2685029 RepID=UPI001A8DD8A2|nr:MULTISPECIES: hypothetical protein [unclassified Corallococcus]MBN9685391.1 hypothetical protein [Corallococcus sp. NCSPR001]WAS83158.1 hypothetical protein O0N60_28035 [Corallococcus sp. NCRR]